MNKTDLLKYDDGGDSSAKEEIDVVTVDWYEDAESEADWAEGLSLRGSNESVPIALTPVTEVKTVVTSSDVFREKNKILEKLLKEIRKKYENLQVENEKLNKELVEERQKTVSYQKKLKYIQDNQEIFNRLKQAYLNMKYNESTGRPMVEIREKACQTWSGILCRACIETAELNRQKQFQELCQFTSNTAIDVNNQFALTVKRDDLTKIEGTIKALRDMIDRREKSWSYNKDREDKLKSCITELEGENDKLRKRLQGTGYIPSVLKISMSSQADLTVKETGALKKIIVKLEKRNREMNLTNLYPKFPSSLNEKELDIIEQIMAKYYKRLQKQNETNIRTMSCDRAMSSKTKLTLSQVPRTVKNDHSDKVSMAHGDHDNDQMNLHKNDKDIDLIDFTEDAPVCIASPNKKF